MTGGQKVGSLASLIKERAKVQLINTKDETPNETCI